ncbi:Beta-lactamase 2, partial [Fusarium albosuccineum]
MQRHPKFVFLAFASILAGEAYAGLQGHCPPLGPVLPAPIHPSNSHAVQTAIDAIRDILLNKTATFNTSGMAVGIKSIHEEDLLLDFAHTPHLVDPHGVAKIDSDSVFRLASLSKIFPVLAILKLDQVSLEDPITKYLPELRDMNKQAIVFKV